MHQERKGTGKSRPRRQQGFQGWGARNYGTSKGLAFLQASSLMSWLRALLLVAMDGVLCQDSAFAAMACAMHACRVQQRCTLLRKAKTHTCSKRVCVHFYKVADAVAQWVWSRKFVEVHVT